MTRIAAEWADPNSLHPWDRNPRRNDAAVAVLAAEIERDGWGAPIVARLTDRRIIAGHTRWKAARELGLAEVPVRFLDVDEATAQRLALADNRLGELASWDDAALAEILRDLDTEGVALDGMGWSDDDLSALLGAHENGPDEGSAGGGQQAMQGTYAVLVTCTDERHQRTVLEQLAEEGLECRAWNL